MRQHPQPPGEFSGGLGVHEPIRPAKVPDAPAGLGGRDRQADRQMRLAHPGRTEQDDVLGTVEESQLVQALDLLTLDAGLEAEVELPQRRPPAGVRSAWRPASGGCCARSSIASPAVTAPLSTCARIASRAPGIFKASPAAGRAGHRPHRPAASGVRPAVGRAARARLGGHRDAETRVGTVGQGP